MRDRITVHRVRVLAAILACLVTVVSDVAAQTVERAGEVSLDSLLNTRISTASKYLQRSSEVAASVTILSADEIHHLGYSNVQELLESVPGMYVSNDRNYPYLGTRGFGRPADYNNRILVLIDGHTLNEQVWGSAPVGTDLPINLSAIERVEVVRGPGSALYGTSAMFAVINVVTKTGTQLNGSNVQARIGSGMDRQIGITTGRNISAHSSYAISAQMMSTDGLTLHYPEFASDPNTRGTVRGLDWERGGSVMGSLVARGITTRVGYRTRSKGVPTGSFETLFGDSRAHTNDQAIWADVALRTTFRTNYQFSTRLYADRTTYSGSLPYEPAVAYLDRSNNTAVGGESMVTWDATSRNRLTVGTEVRSIIRADYFGGNADVPETGANVPFTVASLFAQDELELGSHIKLVGGLRYDRRLTRWHAIAPRFALVATPTSNSTFKALYGEAYRSPSVVEGDLDAQFYKVNRSLRAERIASYELVAEQRIRPTLMASLSAYQYSIRDLIEQIESDTMSGTRFGNLQPVRGRGFEASVNYQPTNSPASLRAWYALQRTRDDSTGLQLSNSPNQTLNVALMLRHKSMMHGALLVRQESGRRMLNGLSTGAFTRADLNVALTPAALQFAWMNGFEFSMRVSNVLDSRYAVPGGLEHVQSSLEQNGRMFSLRVSRDFR